MVSTEVSDSVRDIAVSVVAECVVSFIINALSWVVSRFVSNVTVLLLAACDVCIVSSKMIKHQIILL